MFKEDNFKIIICGDNMTIFEYDLIVKFDDKNIPKYAEELAVQSLQDIHSL